MASLNLNSENSRENKKMSDESNMLMLILAFTGIVYREGRKKKLKCFLEKCNQKKKKACLARDNQLMKAEEDKMDF